MRAKPILFFSCVGLLCGYLIYREAGRTGQPGVVSIGDQAPDFSIKDPNGQLVKLSEYRGKVIFLNFWATWCGPCITEAPEIDLLNNTFKGRKFQMLTISSDNDWKSVTDFHQEHNLTFPVLHDPGQQISKYVYKTTGLPETFLIDANGFVVKHTYAAHWAAPAAVAQVQELVREAEETP